MQVVVRGCPAGADRQPTCSAEGGERESVRQREKKATLTPASVCHPPVACCLWLPGVAVIPYRL